MNNTTGVTLTQHNGSGNISVKEQSVYSQGIISPGQIIEELENIKRQMEKGANALYDAEVRMADAEAAYDKAVSLAFLNSQGTVADRQAVAKLQAVEEKLKADLARAEFNRIKLKMKTLADQATMTAVISKNVELQWKG